MPTTADSAWLRAYDDAKDGDVVAPRGRSTLELLHQTHTINMRYPVVTVPERMMGYRFMAAEALWILQGKDEIDHLMLEPLRQYSDDGKTMRGAYGPRVMSQMNYVVSTLARDRETRQASLTTWTPNPAPSKDIPCTLAMDFKLRNGKLNMSVFMRSSDIWLGLPYDMFSFTAIAWMVTAYLNINFDVEPGMLRITAASSHLYLDDANVSLPVEAIDIPPPAPEALWLNGPSYLLDYLEKLRDARPGDPIRWWE